MYAFRDKISILIYLINAPEALFNILKKQNIIREYLTTI
jgi:hypothetical protein